MPLPPGVTLPNSLYESRKVTQERLRALAESAEVFRQKFEAIYEEADATRNDPGELLRLRSYILSVMKEPDISAYISYEVRLLRMSEKMTLRKRKYRAMKRGDYVDPYSEEYKHERETAEEERQRLEQDLREHEQREALGLPDLDDPSDNVCASEITE